MEMPSGAITLIIAIYGAVVSTCTPLFNIWREVDERKETKRERGRLSVGLGKAQGGASRLHRQNLARTVLASHRLAARSGVRDQRALDRRNNLPNAVLLCWVTFRTGTWPARFR